MWSVLKKSPFKATVSLAYFSFLIAFAITGFLPAHATDSITGYLNIPSAGISTPTTNSWLDANNQFYVPSSTVGVYRRAHKIFLMAHSTAAFENLHQAAVGDDIFFNGHHYQIVAKTQKFVEDINMRQILRATEEDTLILMTCAGENNSQRLIITAK